MFAALNAGTTTSGPVAGGRGARSPPASLAGRESAAAGVSMAGEASSVAPVAPVAPPVFAPPPAPVAEPGLPPDPPPRPEDPPSDLAGAVGPSSGFIVAPVPADEQARDSNSSAPRDTGRICTAPIGFVSHGATPEATKLAQVASLTRRRRCKDRRGAETKPQLVRKTG